MLMAITIQAIGKVIKDMDKVFACSRTGISLMESGLTMKSETKVYITTVQERSMQGICAMGSLTDKVRSLLTLVGTMDYPNGDRYEGDLVNSEKHGRGNIRGQV